MNNGIEKANNLITEVMKNGISGLMPDEFVVKVEFIEYADAASGSDKRITIICGGND